VTLEFGSKVSRIESRAFVGCSKLSSICIQSPIGEFPADCFNGCSQLSITKVDPESGRASGDDTSPLLTHEPRNLGRRNESGCHLEHIGQDN
jgi:hypothetical protein